MSTGGVYQTDDGGASWNPANVGVKAYFFPDPWPEFGQCVHKIASHPDHPERMYLQNHHGVYRTDDGGAHWESIADGLPSDFGFPIVVDPNDADTVYVFPLVADGERIPPKAKPRVWRSRDAGSTWTELADGLPRTASTASCCATRCAQTTAHRPASTSARGTAVSGRATMRVTPGTCWPATCPMCCV